MENKKLSVKEKELIKKYESPSKKNMPKPSLREDYLKQTDRNYKDGDRN